MTELQQELFEKQLASIAKGFDYPRTPDIAGPVMRRLRAPMPQPFLSRRIAWSLAAILVFISSLMLIPPVRAAVIEFIQVGVVRIFRGEPTPSAPSTEESLVPVTVTPAATSQPLIPILEQLAGERSLEGAQQLVDYPILLPSYPPDLGEPDRVFVQDADGNMTVLVWIDPQQPNQVLMSLHMIPPGSWAIDKMGPVEIEETTVNGKRAVWAMGPYPLRFSNGNLDFVRLIDGHVLIWTDGEVTYRLETRLNLQEAIKVAESLEPSR